jgi:hypothetical protein
VKRDRGYSALELLCLVAVVAIIAAIAIPNLNAMKERVKYKQTKATFATILAGAALVHQHGQVLVQAFAGQTPGTGSCSMCLQGATPGGDPLTWKLEAADAHWKILGFDQAPTDGWGRELIMKANEGEFEYPPFSGPLHSDARYDAIYSAGADHLWCGNGDGDQVCGDDLMLLIPHLDPLRTGHEGSNSTLTIHGDVIGQ